MILLSSSKTYLYTWIDLNNIIVDKITIVSGNERQSELKALLCVFLTSQLFHPFPKCMQNTEDKQYPQLLGRAGISLVSWWGWWNQLNDNIFIMLCIWREEEKFWWWIYKFLAKFILRWLMGWLKHVALQCQPGIHHTKDQQGDRQ